MEGWVWERKEQRASGGWVHVMRRGDEEMVIPALTSDEPPLIPLESGAANRTPAFMRVPGMHGLPVQSPGDVRECGLGALDAFLQSLYLLGLFCIRLAQVGVLLVQGVYLILKGLYRRARIRQLALKNARYEEPFKRFPDR